MARLPVLIIFVSSVCTTYASRFMERSLGRLSSKALWRQAVSETLEEPRWHQSDWSSLSSDMKSEFQTEAQTRWQDLLRARHQQKLQEGQQQQLSLEDQSATDQSSDGINAAAQQLLEGTDVADGDEHQLTATAISTTSTTTKNPALQRLLSGIDGNPASVVQESEKAQPDQAMLQQEVVSKLTAGMAQEPEDDDKFVKFGVLKSSTTATTTGTASTTNQAFQKLIAGMNDDDPPPPESSASSGNDPPPPPPPPPPESSASSDDNQATIKTTTEDPRVAAEREFIERARRAKMRTLTAGMAQAAEDDEREATATTTTTTTNPAVQRLLSGMDDASSGDNQATTATTTTEAPQVLFIEDESKIESWPAWRRDLPRKIEGTATVTTTTTTTTNTALLKLVSGMDDIDGSTGMAGYMSLLASTAKSTTTEDPKVVKQMEEQQRAAMLQREVVQKLTAGMAEISAEDARAATAQTTAATTATTTTTINPALRRLLSGVDGNGSPEETVDEHQEMQVTASATTTTSTSHRSAATENPEVVRQKEMEKQQIAAIQKEVIGRLTSGFKVISQEEELEASATTTTVATTTTTVNQAVTKLLNGVNAPAIGKSMIITSTTTTTTQTIGAAGRKTLAFISSGKFSFPQHQNLNAAAGDADNDDNDDDDDSDSDDHKKDDDADDSASGSEAAAYFDMEAAEAGL